MDQKEQLFNELIAHSKNSIFRVCYSFLDNQEDIKDLRQEIYIEIWKSLHRFKGKSAWNTYIFRIAINTAIRFKTRIIHLKTNENQSDTIHDVPEMMEEGRENFENLHQLHHAIKQLPDNDRLLISLVLEDLSYKEIADVLNINIGHAGVKIGRAKQKLKKLMENENR
jgi:RNA polymerase sigma-70 factor, ECF subfamily